MKLGGPGVGIEKTRYWNAHLPVVPLGAPALVAVAAAAVSGSQ